MFSWRKRFDKKPVRPGLGLYIDALYGYVPLPEYIRWVIDLPIFQRTREIRQLSTVYLVYSGAVHTRFDHSIGVCHLAAQAHSVLADKAQSIANAPALDKATLAALRLAACLHDVGHGPFGHVYEFYCRREPGYGEWRHERVTEAILKGESSRIADITDELPRILKRIQAMMDGPSSGLLEPENILAIADGKPLKLSGGLSDRYHFLTQVIPSAFGVDRLDYLRRDALFSGVATGNVDIWEILTSLTIQETAPGRWELRLESQAAISLEALLETRNVTFRRLYHYPLHRSAQELIIRGFLELGEAPERLALATDVEVLAKLDRARAQSSKAFCGEVHDRIRHRALYEIFRLISHREARDALGAAALDDYDRLPFAQQRAIEEDLAKKAGMTPGSGRLFFDRELTTAVKLEDYETPWFIDPRNPTRAVNLFALQPHLRELYDGGRARAFNESVSYVDLSLPIGRLVEVSRSVSGAGTEQVAERIYRAVLEPVVHGFFDKIVQAKPKDAKPVIDRLEQELRRQLEGLVSSGLGAES